MNTSEWQSQLNKRLSILLNRAKTELPNTAYGFLSAAALAPLVSAFANGGPGALWAAMGPVVGGIGGNLLANQVQKWVDLQNASDSEEAFAAQFAEELIQQAETETEWRDTLDEIHQKLASLQLVQQSANDETRSWFVQTLRAELAKLGNLNQYAKELIRIENSGSGSTLIGTGNAAGERGLAAQTINAETLNTGDTTHHHHYYPQTRSENAERRTKNAELRLTYLHALRNECEALPLTALGATWKPDRTYVWAMSTLSWIQPHE